MAYQRPPYLQMLLQERLNEKHLDQQLQQHFIKDAHEQKQQKQFQQVQDARTAFQLFTSAYEGAQTPAQKEAIYQRGQQFRGMLLKNSPILAQYMDVMLKGSPLEQKEIRRREWLKTNKEIKPPAFKPEDNAQLYAQQAWSHELWKKAMHRAVDDEDYIMPLHIGLGKDQVSFMNEQGKVTVTNWDRYNEDLDEIGKSVGVTGAYLQHTGGWLEPQTQVLRLAQSDGSVREVLYETQYNMLNGQRRSKQFDVGLSKGAGDGAGGGKLPDLMSPPAKEIRDALAVVSGGKLMKNKDPITNFISDETKAILAKYEDEPERAEAEINRVFQGQDDRYTYVVTGRDDEAKYNTTLFGTKLKFGEGAYIRAVPGQLRQVDTSDGVPIQIIYDDRNNAVYNSSGVYLGTSDHIRHIAAMTSKALGIAPPHEPQLPSKAPMTSGVEAQLEAAQKQLEKLLGQKDKVRLTEQEKDKRRAEFGIDSSASHLDMIAKAHESSPAVVSLQEGIKRLQEQIEELQKQFGKGLSE